MEGDPEMSELKLNPKYTEAVTEVVNRSLRISHFSPWKSRTFNGGTAHLEIELGEKHLQPFGFVHGGAIASLMDAAAFWAVFPQVENGMGLTTVEIKVNFLAPTQKGKLVAKGRCIRLGKTLALGETEIRNTREAWWPMGRPP